MLIWFLSSYDSVLNDIHRSPRCMPFFLVRQSLDFLCLALTARRECIFNTIQGLQVLFFPFPNHLPFHQHIRQVNQPEQSTTTILPECQVISVTTTTAVTVVLVLLTKMMNNMVWLLTQVMTMKIKKESFWSMTDPWTTKASTTVSHYHLPRLVRKTGPALNVRQENQ